MLAVQVLMPMKTISKINPEEEYQKAKAIIELAMKDQRLSTDNANTLDSSVDNLITAARVLMEREERRRGYPRPPKETKKKGGKAGSERGEVNKLPSQKFPDLEIKETTIAAESVPRCPCCSKEMRESQLFDITEKLEFVPSSYWIHRIKRPKYNCGNCHGPMVNTPALPSIVEKSNYGDSFIINIMLSKYCDLIPIERQVSMAERNGLEGLAPQSLIGLTHHLANFLFELYLLIKKEVQDSLVLLADETPHKMLEGDESRNWYLWGFFTSTACYFEAQNTRSGDVPKSFLKESKATHLLSDGYTGYAKAVREIKEESGRVITEVHCNAHAVRYFKLASEKWTDELNVILNLYKEIYTLEEQVKKQKTSEAKLETRQKMLPLFEQIKKECQSATPMPKSAWEQSINYFLNHYEGLTLCSNNPDLPLDNNLSEREIRSPVVGRKTWYGTHSKRGALTCAIHFSIVQSCKINNLNPRNYLPWVVERIHKKEQLLTPSQYSKLESG